MTQDIVDIDGFGRKGSLVTPVIGGWIGQLAMVLNTIAKHYPRLDTGSLKSQRSGKRPKSEASEGREVQSEEVKENHEILSPDKIQTFIYMYVLEKLKVEKLSIQVDPKFEQFLNNLGTPLELNQMRTMKLPNWEKLRELLRQFSGGIVLNLMRDH